MLANDKTQQIEERHQLREWTVRLVKAEDESYEQAWTLARTVFRGAFGAELTRKPPSYFVFEETLGASSIVQACMSATPAIEGKLFSERYLKDSVETYISGGNAQVTRETIMEVGSLSNTGNPNNPVHLIRASIFKAWFEHRWSHALITITPPVARLLKHIGVVFNEICIADPSRLPAEEVASWGTYYDQIPRVYIIDIRASFLNNIDVLPAQSSISLCIQGITGNE